MTTWVPGIWKVMQEREAGARRQLVAVVQFTGRGAPGKRDSVRATCDVAACAESDAYSFGQRSARNPVSMKACGGFLVCHCHSVLLWEFR